MNDLTDVESVSDWLSNTFVPGLMSWSSFSDTCSLSKMRAAPYTFGRLSRIPAFTIRVLGDEATWGCEAPYTNFLEPVDVAGYQLRGYDSCTAERVENNGTLDHGGFYFFTGYGFTCAEPPSVPPLFSSACQEDDAVKYPGSESPVSRLPFLVALSSLSVPTPNAFGSGRMTEDG